MQLLSCVLFILVCTLHSGSSLQLKKFYQILNLMKEEYTMVDHMFKGSYSDYVQNSVNFWLYTRERPNLSHQLIPDDVETLTVSNFDGTKPTKVLIHGWMGNGEDYESLCVILKAEYFKSYDYNVICVDWGRVTYDLPYFTARRRCKEIGNYLASMITMLLDNTPQKTDDIHLIGFSMGAHVAGYAGKQMNGQLNRVTGLDPARPLFSIKQPAERLSENDAKFVDVVHTTSLLLGQHQPIGNVDFYPNGGNTKQPGCGYEYISAEVCSHYRSYQYYSRSIYSKDEFVSVRCDGWKDFQQSECDENNVTYLGEHANPK